MKLLCVNRTSFNIECYLLFNENGELGQNVADDALLQLMAMLKLKSKLNYQFKIPWSLFKSRRCFGPLAFGGF